MERDYFTCTHRIVLSTFWNQGQVLTNYQVSVHWWVLKLFLQSKPAFSGHVPLSHHQSPSLSSPPLPWVLACALIVTCKWQRVMHEPETCMTLDSQSFFRLYLWAKYWRAKGAVLIITFFCIIYRYFWLSMLVPSFLGAPVPTSFYCLRCSSSKQTLWSCCRMQGKLVSDSLVLVDLAIRLVNSVFNSPDEQVMFYKAFE